MVTTDCRKDSEDLVRGLKGAPPRAWRERGVGVD